MDLFKATMQNMANFSQGFGSNHSKEEKLREQLYHCTYSDE